MGLFARPMAILREIHRQLNEDLRDLDLYSLRYETLNNPDDELTKSRWVRLLNNIAPQLVVLGKEVKKAESYVNAQKSDIQSTMGMISIVLLSVTIILSFLLCKGIDNSINIIGILEKIFHIIILVAVTSLLTKVVMITMGERVRQYEFEVNEPTHTLLSFYRTELSDNPLIKLAALKITGQDIDNVLDEVFPRSEISSTKTLALSCNQDKQGTAPPIVTLVEKSCSADKEGVLVALQQIKKNYDRFDRLTVWTEIHSKFSALRSFFEKQTADNQVTKSTVPGIVREEIGKLFIPKVLEFIHMRLRDEFIPKDLQQGAFLEQPLKQWLISPPVRCETKAAAWRMFAAAAEDNCIVAVFACSPQSPEGYLFKIKSYAAIEECFITEQNKNEIGSIFVAMRKPPKNTIERLFIGGYVPTTANLTNMGFEIKSNVVISNLKRDVFQQYRNALECDAVFENKALKSSNEISVLSFFMQFPLTGGERVGDDVKEFYLRVDVSTLFEQMAKNARSCAFLLLDQRDYIASDISDVMHKYGFAFDLLEFRKVIEGQLIKAYSLEDFDRHIRRIMLDTLRVADTKILAMKKSPLVSLISDYGLRRKVQDMTDTKWIAFLRNVVPIIEKMRDQKNIFPRYMPAKDKLTRLAILGHIVPIVLFILLSSFLVIIDSFIRNLEQPYWDTVLFTVFLTSLAITVVGITEVMFKKSIAILDRQSHVVDVNSFDLINATTRTIEYLVNIRRIDVEGTSTGSPEETTKGDTSMQDAKLAIKYFYEAQTNHKRCNYLNTDSRFSSMPEIVMYLMIMLVFVIVAIYVTVKMDPMASIENVKRLGSVITLIKSGELDKSMFSEAFDTSSCLVPVAPLPLILKLFATILFLILTLWLLTINQNIENQYVRHLEELRDCSEIKHS